MLAALLSLWGGWSAAATGEGEGITATSGVREGYKEVYGRENGSPTG